MTVPEEERRGGGYWLVGEASATSAPSDGDGKDLSCDLWLILVVEA